jgi:hypothetical protein
VPGNPTQDALNENTFGRLRDWFVNGSSSPPWTERERARPVGRRITIPSLPLPELCLADRSFARLL